ncbi:hypothetical protein NL676_023966 [Syzygium grande]|nr:hypothetical protein NL676_023966 [Syzygium grande]
MVRGPDTGLKVRQSTVGPELRRVRYDHFPTHQVSDPGRSTHFLSPRFSPDPTNPRSRVDPPNTTQIPISPSPDSDLLPQPKPIVRRRIHFRDPVTLIQTGSSDRTPDQRDQLPPRFSPLLVHLDLMLWTYQTIQPLRNPRG